MSIDDARESLDQLRFARIRVELDPDDPEGHLELGRLLLTHGRLEAADQSFEAVLRIEPGDANARYFRALIAQAWGRSEHATRELVKLMRRFPQADILWPALGDTVDRIVRRTHLYLALILFPATGMQLTVASYTADWVRGFTLITLLLAAVYLVIRVTITASTVGAGILRSLVAMRFRHDPGVRTSLILDAAVVVLLTACLVVPFEAMKPLGVVALLALIAATIAHAFQRRETDVG